MNIKNTPHSIIIRVHSDIIDPLKDRIQSGLDQIFELTGLVIHVNIDLHNNLWAYINSYCFEFVLKIDLF